MLGQDLPLRSCGEQLGVEELVARAPIERLGKAVLARGYWRDVRRAGAAAGVTPVP